LAFVLLALAVLAGLDGIVERRLHLFGGCVFCNVTRWM
jgi:hypothetical protein